MNPTPVTEYSAWCWQIGRILRLRRGACHGWLGWYDWQLSANGTLTDHITYINIKPIIGRYLLRHEQGHAAITRLCRTVGEMRMANEAWDAYTWHGWLFWRKP